MSPGLKWLLCALVLTSSLSCQVTAAAHVTNRIVSLAPEVTLINGNDDIDPAGSCVAETKRYCSDLTAGDGRLADCISNQMAESESLDHEEGTGPTITEACREEVYQFKIVRNTNINYNVQLAKACKVDAEKNCNVIWLFGYKAGQVLGCLKDIKGQLAPACKKLIFKVQADAAEDYRADAELHDACKADADHLCKDVKTGGGRVQGCMRDNRAQLTWLCGEQLFRQEIQDSDDIRLSVRLYRNCAADKRKFCNDVEIGSSRVKDCLEENRTKPTFSPACKDEIDGMIERRVRDFRLDPQLRSACKEDIYAKCSYFDLDTPGQDGHDVVRCLQNSVDKLTNPTCKQQVFKYQQLAAEDIRFNVELADACDKDRQRFCGDVPPGNARVIRCLIKTRDQLSSTCRARLFKEQVWFSQNIDFQYPMKQACEQELEVYCKDVPHGEARAIRCLQENKHQKDFSKECKEEVRSYEVEAASDYRLNYRLAKSCKADIKTLCTQAYDSQEGQVYGVAVLRCLTDNRADIENEVCKQEVLFFEQMEVMDYINKSPSVTSSA